MYEVTIRVKLFKLSFICSDLIMLFLKLIEMYFRTFLLLFNLIINTVVVISPVDCVDNMVRFLWIKRGQSVDKHGYSVWKTRHFRFLEISADFIPNKYPHAFQAK